MAAKDPEVPTQTKGKVKGKLTYDKLTNEGQSFLVDFWAEKHERLESKDAMKVWQEISKEIELNFCTKKIVEKCQRKTLYLVDKYKDAKLKKDRKRPTERKLSEVGGDEKTVSLKKSIESMGKQGEKFPELIQIMQQNPNQVT